MGCWHGRYMTLCRAASHSSPESSHVPGFISQHRASLTGVILTDSLGWLGSLVHNGWRGAVEPWPPSAQWVDQTRLFLTAISYSLINACNTKEKLLTSFLCTLWWIMVCFNSLAKMTDKTVHHLHLNHNYVEWLYITLPLQGHKQANVRTLG